MTSTMKKILNLIVLWLMVLVSLYLGLWGLATGQRRSGSVLVGAFVFAGVAVLYARYYQRICGEITHWFDRAIVHWFVLWTVIPLSVSIVYLVTWKQRCEDAFLAHASATEGDSIALWGKYMAIKGEVLWVSFFAFVIPIFVLIIVIRLVVLVITTQVSERVVNRSRS